MDIVTRPLLLDDFMRFTLKFLSSLIALLNLLIRSDTEGFALFCMLRKTLVSSSSQVFASSFLKESLIF
ncbi:ORF108 [White spot syndrome virus]|uniref:ORF108 n=1 Tax=White spot syndrome virus TaxID=342409 RepID=A0A2D3I6L3_9VIRU|nr:ORF108 [White spot syndrome virus]